MIDKSSKRCLMVTTGVLNTGGGIANVNRLVIQSFLNQGYCVDIYSLLESPDVQSSISFDTQNIVFNAFSGNKYRFGLAVWQSFIGNSYRYVFVDHVNLGGLFFPFSIIGLCHYIVWLHGIEVFPPRPDLEGRVGLKFAGLRISSSEYTKTIVERNYPHLSVIACDLAIDSQHPIDARFFLDNSVGSINLKTVDGTEQELGNHVILHVGRMISGERYKGQESLIRAFPLVYDHHPEAQLVLAGQGDDMPRLISLATALPPTMQARIFLPGFVPNDLLDQIYRLSYIFAMPSVGEGFGLVYLEAMLRAKACLGGNVDATPYVVRDGVTGLLVDDPRSPEQVATALNWFLSHPDETREMGLQGAELVRSYYLFSHFQERFWKAVGHD